MAVKPFTKEELNFFKFSSIVLEEFPKALRQTFITMWDSKIGVLPGYQPWDDSAAVRNMLLRSEGGKTDIPTNKPINDWDCTALFKATIFAQTFALPSSKGLKKTLAEIYLKRRKPKPSPFHPSVNSPSGDQDETLALATDQLRLLRNTLCHSAEPRINKADFDQHVLLAKDAFTAANLPTAPIDAIGCLSETDFPTGKVEELKERIQKELHAINLFLQDKVIGKLCDIDERMEALPDQFDALRLGIREVQETTPMIHEELRKIRSKVDNDDAKCDISGNQNSLPKSCLPPMVPHFTGRTKECEKIIASMTSESMRLVNICGSPGFGKTSTAIAVGHGLESQGHSVYFFTCRGISSQNELISKLLSFFWRSTKSIVSPHLTPADKLCGIFRELPCRFSVILDNLDDLLACSKPGGKASTSVKDDVLHLIEEILVRCRKVRFLTTSRESLQFLDLKMEGNESVRIGPLDQLSSEDLVSQFLPCAAQGIPLQITQICGNVPLAIKLLCSLIREYNLTPSECLNDIVESSESILEVLDNPDYSSDLRLKILFESSIARLALKEREAFISLSVFDSADFDSHAAAAVIGGKKLRALQTLRILVRNSLIDMSAESKTYSLHPLLRFFAIEMGERELREVAHSSKTRFYEYYTHLLNELNRQFLTESSLMAFSTFFEAEQHILLSFSEGYSREGLCDELFKVLATSEMFLAALYVSNEERVQFLYDVAMKKALDKNNDEAYCRLAVSKCFRKTLEINEEETLVPESRKIQKIIDSMLDGTGAKCLCYQGIYDVSNGRAERGVELIEKGLQGLNNSHDHQIVKCLTLQLLALYYNSLDNVEKEEVTKQFKHNTLNKCKLEIGNPRLFLITGLVVVDDETEQQSSGEGTTPSNQPLILGVISTLSIWARNFLSTEMKDKLSNIVAEMQRQIEAASQSWDSKLATLFQIGDLALAFLCADETLIQSINIALEQGRNAVKQRPENNGPLEKTKHQKFLEERLAECYFRRGWYYSTKTKYDFALQSYQNALDVRLELNGEQHAATANVYDQIGALQNNKGDYTSALQSERRALDILLQLHGEQHKSAANSYHQIGITQNNMGDYNSSLESLERALDIRLKLYNEQHPTTADSYHQIGIIQNDMGDYNSSLESLHRALDIRLKLYNEQHPTTADSYHQIGIIQNNMGDYNSSFESHRQALRIRLVLYGWQHPTIADSYHQIGITQNNMKDYASSLESYRQALHIRLELYGNEHPTTAEKYLEVGLLQNNMGNYTSALRSLQRALIISLKLHGKEHRITAYSYFIIGITKKNIGDLTLSLRSHQKALSIGLKLYREQHPEVAKSYYELGVTQHLMEDFPSALESFRKALEIISKMHGEQHPATANVYHKIGNTQNAMSDFTSALQSFHRALNIRLNLYGEQHADTAQSYHDIGITQNKKGDHTSALQSHSRALDIKEKLFGEQYVGTASSYREIAMIQSDIGDYTSALQSLQRALAINLELCGEQHAVTAYLYREIGIVHRNKEEWNLALHFFQRALDIRSNIFGDQHKNTAQSYDDVRETMLRKRQKEIQEFHMQNKLSEDE